jgi:hypothetical protein
MPLRADASALGRWSRLAGAEADRLFGAISDAGWDEDCAVLIDGVPLVPSEGHVFVPANWVAREYPDVADLALKIEHRIRSRHCVSRPEASGGREGSRPHTR